MKFSNLHLKFKNCFIVLILLFVSVNVVGQCAPNIIDVSATAANPDGTNIAIPNPNCDGAFALTGGLPNSLNGGANITINGVTFQPGNFCDGNMNEVFNVVGAAIGLPASYTVDIGGTICEYDAAGNLINGEVPTLSEWGLIILALLFMTMGTLVLINHKELAINE